MLCIKAKKPEVSFHSSTDLCEIKETKIIERESKEEVAKEERELMAYQAPRTYEDFEPRFDWVHDEASNTLVVPLEGFSRDKLRVQVTTSRVLRISGERLMEGNRWRRFNKEFPLPLDSDTNDIGAKFQSGMLYVRCPKLITPSPKPHPPAVERQPSAEELASKRQPQPPHTQKPPQEQAASPKPTTRDEKAEEDVMKKKPETTEQQDYGQPRDQKTIPQDNDKAEARTSETKEQQEDYEERPSDSEGLRYRQFQSYRNSLVGLVGDLRRQKKLANLLVAILMLLLLGLYVKNSIKSSLGGSKTQDL